ncbi:MAG: hypothetical protein KDE56_13660, partial [Anaerolineales bacterium]|nr:hypothetical protein [Anaerolineales bacterium]
MKRLTNKTRAYPIFNKNTPHPTLYALLLSLLILFLQLAWLITPAHAQSCSHVTFRVDSTASLDRTAVCDAAQPWADKGIQTFIYITDQVTDNEGDWYQLLDAIETDAGFRSGENFDPNVLAFEASSSGDPWAATLTYGANLFDTALDQNESSRVQIANNLQNTIISGDATQGFVQALNESYAVNYPAASGSSAESGGFGGAATAVGAIAAAGAAAAGGYILNKQVLQPARSRRKKEEAQRAHLAELRQNIANLLLACERLLQGDTPQDTVLYQVFDAYGGTHYADRKTAVTEWVRRSQAALNAAFDLRRDLLDEETQQKQTLEQQIRSWETIYLTLVGSSPRVLELTDAELHDLLDPMITLERKEQETPLVKQLVDIQRELQGKPLRVDLQAVDPATVDHEGILGYIDQVEQQLNELMGAQSKAPESLDAARRARLDLEQEADSARPFGLTGSEVLAGLDARLAQAKANLDHGIYLHVLEETADLERDLNIVDDLIAAESQHRERLGKIDRILQQGYHPAPLASDRDRIATNQEKVTSSVTAGDYLAADKWLDEYEAASSQALTNAEQWRSQHQFNLESLERIGAELVHVEGYLNQEAVPAWRGLQNYPPGNWKTVTQGLDEPRRTLEWLKNQELPRIETMNSMETQQFPAAEAALVEAGAKLMQAERQMQTIVNRLAEIKAAENNIREGLKLAQADLAQAVSLRDAEDVKVGPEIDTMLAEAEESLRLAGGFAQEREFIAATHAQTKARKLAQDGYAQATEQVQRINTLQGELEALGQAVEPAVKEVLADGDGLPAVIMTADINHRLQEVARTYSQAQQARAQIMSQEDHKLAGALQTAVSAFQTAQTVAQTTADLIRREVQSYSDLVDQTDRTILQATEAIARAQRLVSSANGSGGYPALQRAIGNLPNRTDLHNASRDRL